MGSLERLKVLVLQGSESLTAAARQTDAALWQYEHAPDVWHSFDDASACKLEASFQDLRQAGNPQGEDVQLSFRHHTRIVNVSTMVQRNPDTGKQRGVRRLDLLEFAPRLQSEKVLQGCCAALTKHADAARRSLEGALDELEVASRRADSTEWEGRAHAAALAEAQASLRESRAERGVLQAENEDLRAQLQALREQGTGRAAEPEAEAGRLQRRCTELERRLARGAEESAQSINKFREAVEMWRDPQMRSILEGLHYLEDKTLHDRMQSILRGTSHGGVDSQCTPMQEAAVTKVLTVLNPGLWTQYCQTKDALKQANSDRGGNYAPLRRSQATQVMQRICSEKLYWCDLDEAVNEVWAFHGTKIHVAQSIAATGLDPKRCLNGFYGRGFYLAQESCKSLQYTDAGKFGQRAVDGCIVLCRAVLGEPEYVRAPAVDKRAPADSCNSVVVNPGPEGGPPQQQHQELLLFDTRQAYPEFIIFFKVPPGRDADGQQRAPPPPAAAASVPPGATGSGVPLGNNSDDDDDDYDDCADNGECQSNQSDHYDDNDDDGDDEQYIGDYSMGEYLPDDGLAHEDRADDACSAGASSYDDCDDHINHNRSEFDEEDHRDEDDRLDLESVDDHGSVYDGGFGSDDGF